MKLKSKILKQKIIIIQLLILCFFISSCESENDAIKFEGNLFFDSTGKGFNLDNTPQRVISLAPSITEILFFISADKQVVARTQACDFPEKANKLTVVSTYPLDIESIVKLNPDLVLAVEGIINPDQVNKLEELGVKVFFQKYETIDDINESIITIGSLLGKGEKASLLVDSLSSEMENIKILTKNKLQALMLTWRKPIFVYGNDTPFTDKIELSGAENAMKEILNSPYPEITREYLLKMNPDIILGYPYEVLDTSFFMIYPELKNIKAYTKRQIFDVNDNLMSRPSPRYIESIIELKNILSKCE